MKLIDIVTQEARELSKEAEEYLKKEYPANTFFYYYNRNRDMCLSESSYINMVRELEQEGFLFDPNS